MFWAGHGFSHAERRLISMEAPIACPERLRVMTRRSRTGGATHCCCLPRLAPKTGARTWATGPVVFSSYSEFFPYSRIIRYVKYRLLFSVFDNFSHVSYSDYFVAWITGRKSRRRVFQVVGLEASFLATYFC